MPSPISLTIRPSRALSAGSVARLERGVDDLAAQPLEIGQRAVLVRPHQARVADHVGG